VEAVKILNNINDIGTHYFTDRDVVRHKLVQKIILAYEKHESAKSQNPKPFTGSRTFAGSKRPNDEQRKFTPRRTFLKK